MKDSSNLKLVSFDGGRTYHSLNSLLADRLDAIIAGYGAHDFYTKVEHATSHETRDAVRDETNTPWWAASSFNPSDKLAEYAHYSPRPITVDLTDRLDTARLEGPYPETVAFDAYTLRGYEAGRLDGFDQAHAGRPMSEYHPWWDPEYWYGYSDGYAEGTASDHYLSHPNPSHGRNTR